MDNKKIGKLIAKLRNEKELTQQELGDMVGVGFRAVSKWERGLTMPDIGIVNELSQILGITSDELLSGELKQSKHNKDKKKIPTKIKVILSVLFSLIVIITSVFLYYQNKTYTYTISSANEDEYVVKGQLTLQGNNVSLLINQIRFKDKTFLLTKIKNYDYTLYLENKYVFGYGYTPNGEYMETPIITIKEFCDNFRINYNNKTDILNKKTIKRDLKLVISFIEEDNNKNVKELNLLLSETKDDKKAYKPLKTKGLNLLG